MPQLLESENYDTVPNYYTIIIITCVTAIIYLPTYTNARDRYNNNRFVEILEGLYCERGRRYMFTPRLQVDLGSCCFTLESALKVVSACGALIKLVARSLYADSIFTGESSNLFERKVKD